MQALDQKGVGIERGRESIEASDLKYEVIFDQYEPLSGFVGYEDTSIKAIGFYRYKCASRPEDVTGTEGETTGEGETDGTGEGEGENTGTGENGTVDGGITPGPGGDGTVTTGEENENDKNLDEGEARDNDSKDTLNTLTAQNNDILQDVDEELDLSWILIILVCVLVPLVIVLASIVYLFRKNKQNAIQAAIVRRQSSMKRQ